jgi:hypothetical protein
MRRLDNKSKVAREGPHNWLEKGEMLRAGDTRACGVGRCVGYRLCAFALLRTCNVMIRPRPSLMSLDD